MKASQSINKTQKTLKEATKMKKATLTTLLILTISFILSTVSYAQGPSNNPGWYHGMASVAENEIRSKEQKANAKKDEKIADSITVADVEKGYLNSSEKTDSIEKTDEVEN